MKKIHIIGLILVAVLIGFIVSMAAQYSRYETFADAKGETAKDFSIIGHLVKNKPQEYDPQKDPNLFSFYLQDNNGEIKKVLFVGSKPEDFERSEQIVLTGRMNGDDFYAKQILMKCPSKYKNDQLVTSQKASL